MVIVSLLPDPRWTDVVHASPRGVVHRRAASPAEFVRLIQHQANPYVVVDPALMADLTFERLATEVAAADAPLLILGPLNRRTVDLCLVAQAFLPMNILLTDMGELDRLQFLLREPGITDVPARLLNRGGHAFARLPTHLRVATVSLFTGAAIPASPRAFARWAGVDPRTVQRWYARAGLAGVSQVLAIARLSRAWYRMHARRHSLVRIARLAGFGSTRTLTRQCHRLAGCRASGVHGYSASEFADRLANALARSRGRASAPRGATP